jgi:hypothetical protein
VSEWSQGLSRTQNMNWGFLLSTTFPKNGLLLRLITYKFHLRVLSPVRGPMTTLDCVLLKDNNHTLVAKLGPEINSRACLCVLQGPRHITKYWFSIQYLVMWRNSLILTTCKFVKIYSFSLGYLELWIHFSRTCSCAEGTGSAVKLSNW